MPTKTPEAMRRQIVTARKAGKSYSKIERELGVRPDVIARTLKEAGLTRGSAPQPEPEAEEEQENGSSRAGDVGEFLPPKRTKKQAEEPEWKEYECAHCGAEFREIAGVTPEACPGCGEGF